MELTFSYGYVVGCGSFIQDKKLKETFLTIPSLEDLQTLEADGLKADIIIVDIEKDKKIFMLKQLSAALVKGLNSSPALVIKKIAGLVSSNKVQMNTVFYLPLYNSFLGAQFHQLIATPSVPQSLMF
jgi:hypothetical protein